MKKLKKSEQREILPYGKWTCEDGREVLFNRYYKPIWQRAADGTVSRASRDEWVKWLKQEWFYDDGTARPDVLKRTRAVLVVWGIEV
jgi:hypothetical protein